MSLPRHRFSPVRHGTQQIDDDRRMRAAAIEVGGYRCSLKAFDPRAIDIPFACARASSWFAVRVNSAIPLTA
jgi:hypothetical protein